MTQIVPRQPDNLSNRAVLVRKLRHWVATPRDEGPCRQIRLSHLTSEYGPQAVNHWTIKPDCDVDDLAAQIEDEASSVAGRFKGMQDFSIAAFYGPGQVPGATHPIRIYIEEDSIGSDYAESAPSEGPHAKGHLSQIMRHNEALFRGVIGFFSEMSRVQMGMIRDLRDDNQRLSTQSMSFREKYEEALDRTAERELKVYQAVQEEDRKSQLTAGAIAVVPPIVNKLIGKPVLPDSNEAEIVFIRNWIRRLELKHLEQMQQFMPAELWMPIALAKEEQMDQDQKAEAEKKSRTKAAAASTKTEAAKEMAISRAARGEEVPPFGPGQDA